MRVLVTGGTGFIGSHLVSLLKERGHTVSILSRRVHGDLKADAAIHLAWEGLPDYSWPTCLKNVELGLKIYEALLKNGCRKIITTGTCWEYGTMNTFAAAKTGLRLMGETLADEKEAQFIWTRLFFVYGPGQRETSLIPSMARKIRNKQTPEVKNPKAVHDFIHVKDVALALALLAEKETVADIVDIGSGKLHSVGDVVQCVVKIMQDEPVNIKPVNDADSWKADISGLQQLGWKPEFDLISGIRNTLQ